MGYGEYGGGGSITWKVDVDHPTAGKKNAVAYGYDAKVVQKFKISLEYPSGTAAQNDLSRLKAATGGMTVQGNKIVFDLDLQQNNEDQVRIEW